MLKFVDSNNELPAWQKDGIAVVGFGLEYATNKTPLDFQYESTENINSFDIVRVNGNREDIETISLNSSLVSKQTNLHVCTGLVDYDTPLFPGFYYYKVNGRYISDIFGIFRIDTIIYTNLSVVNTHVGLVKTLNFTATLDSELNAAHDVTFYIGFSCNIPGFSVSRTAFTNETFALDFNVQTAEFGDCQIRISDNLGGSAVINFVVGDNIISYLNGDGIGLLGGGALTFLQ